MHDVQYQTRCRDTQPYPDLERRRPRLVDEHADRADGEKRSLSVNTTAEAVKAVESTRCATISRPRKDVGIGSWMNTLTEQMGRSGHCQ